MVQLPNFTSKAFLAPMAGVSDPALRIMCKKMGAGLVVTELTSVNAIVAKHEQLESQSKDITEFIEFSEKEHQVTHESSSIYDLKIIALSRLMLAQTLNNISVYWVAYGTKLAQVALSHGGNDLVGTAFSEEIYRAAGKPTNSSLIELATLAKEIGRKPIQRNTCFETLQTFT